MAASVEPGPAELVDVASGLEPYAAHIARGRLEAEGIAAQVLDDQLQNPHGVFEGRPRSRIRVAAEDADAARAILDADYSAELAQLADAASGPPELPSWPSPAALAVALVLACATLWLLARG